MSDDKKKKLFDYIEQSKKGTFDDYNNKIYSFIKTLNLTHDDAEDLLNALAGIEDRDDFYTQAHDVIFTAVDDYKSENEEDNSMKDLIVEGR